MVDFGRANPGTEMQRKVTHSKDLRFVAGVTSRCEAPSCAHRGMSGCDVPVGCRSRTDPVCRTGSLPDDRRKNRVSRQPAAGSRRSNQMTGRPRRILAWDLPSMTDMARRLVPDDRENRDPDEVVAPGTPCIHRRGFYLPSMGDRCAEHKSSCGPLAFLIEGDEA